MAVDQLGVGSFFLQESPGRLSFATEVRHLPSQRRVRPRPATCSTFGRRRYLQRGGTLLRTSAGSRRSPGAPRRRRWADSTYRSLRATPFPNPDPARGHTRVDAEPSRRPGARRREEDDGSCDWAAGSTPRLVARSPTVSIFAADDLRRALARFPGRSEADESSLMSSWRAGSRIPWRPDPSRAEARPPSSPRASALLGLPAPSPMLAFNLPLLRRLPGRASRSCSTARAATSCSVARRTSSPTVCATDACALPSRSLGRLPASRRRHLGHGASGDPPQCGPQGGAPTSRCTGSRGSAAGGAYAPPGSRRRARSSTSTRGTSGRGSAARTEWWAFLAELVTSWREQMGASDYLRRARPLAGVEGRHPLLDDLGLVEHVLRLPPEHGVRPESDRSGRAGGDPRPAARLGAPAARRRADFSGAPRRIAGRPSGSPCRRASRWPRRRCSPGTYRPAPPTCALSTAAAGASPGPVFCGGSRRPRPGFVRSPNPAPFERSSRRTEPPVRRAASGSSSSSCSDFRYTRAAERLSRAAELVAPVLVRSRPQVLRDLLAHDARSREGPDGRVGRTASGRGGLEDRPLANGGEISRPVASAQVRLRP